MRRKCPENIYHSAVSRYSEHQHLVKKGKNVVHLTQDKLENESDLEQIVFGLVTSPVQLAVKSNEVNSWIVDSDATCSISNNKQSFLEFHTPERPQYITLDMVIH